MATPSKAESICYVYWIKRKEHTCIFSQGYVGISMNPSYRYTQHKYFSSKEKYSKNYRSDFRNAVREGDTELTVLLKSSRQYCLDMEEKLRPDWAIGWNLARGGTGGYGTHNLSGTLVHKTYYNLRTRAIAEGEDFFKDWEVGGLEAFYEFYLSKKEESGEFCLRQVGSGYAPSNLIKLPRSEIIRRAYSTYELDGAFYCIEQLAERYGMKPNTISNRIRNGYTLKQALGLEVKQNGIVLEGGDTYLGRLTIENFEWLKQKFKEGYNFRDISTLCEVPISESNLGRLFTKMGLCRDTLTFKNFFNEDVRLGYIRFNFKQIEEVKLMLVEGVGKSKIARHFKVSASTITNLCKLLRWYEYEASLGG